MIDNTPFGAKKIINEQISESTLRGYFVGFDLTDNGQKEYRWKPFVQTLLNVVHEFAFGLHEGDVTKNTETLPQIIEAARAIYKIEEFQKVRDIYLAGEIIEDKIEEKYLRRGEFGELILHLLLRDFHNTIPLLSKIYFKDSYGHAVHGFDAVHIEPASRTLWLGESKLYIDPKRGIKALIGDIKEHVRSDYLESEFSLISKKIRHFNNIPELQKWLNLIHSSTKLSEQIKTINLPLLCTYSSELFQNYSDENQQDFQNEFKEHICELNKYFEQNNDHPLKTDLNIILLLFPIKCKVELVKRLHNKLSLIQKLGE